MPHTISDLLNFAKSHNGSIGVASRYLSDARQCVADAGSCPVDVFGKGSGDDWKKQLEEAESRLVWCDEHFKSADLARTAQESELPPSSVLKFDTVLTTARKDRDGDILEPAGFKHSSNGMVLLWQHNQMMPIGTMVKVLEHTKDIVKASFAIGDTSLGRDAATLVKMGALSVSHGFRPGVFEPLEMGMKDGIEVPKNWHIKEYETFEGSLVSIPSNVDANPYRYYEKSYGAELDGICTAYGRDQLETIAVKSWAKRFYDNRPTQVAGVSTDDLNHAPKTEKSLADHFTDFVTEKAGRMISDKNKKKLRGCRDAIGGAYKTLNELAGDDMDAGKDAPPAIVKSAPVELSTKGYHMNEQHLDGSFEWIQQKLSESAEDLLRDKEKIVGSKYSNSCRVVCTFSDRAIICCLSYHDEKVTKKCYQSAWKIGDEGKPEWTGDVAEVEVVPTVREKWFADFETKQAVDTDAKSASLEQFSLQDVGKMLIAKSMTCPETRKVIKQVHSAASLFGEVEVNQSQV